MTTTSNTKITQTVTMAASARPSQGLKNKVKEISSKGVENIEPILLVSSNSCDECAPSIGKDEKQVKNSN